MSRGTQHREVRTHPRSTDLSVHMLGLPTGRSRLGKWGVVAIVAGTLLAVAVVAFENYVATLF